MCERPGSRVSCKRGMPHGGTEGARHRRGAGHGRIGGSYGRAGARLADGVTVGVAGLAEGGRQRGTLNGTVVNRTNHAAAAKVTVRRQPLRDQGAGGRRRPRCTSPPSRPRPTGSRSSSPAGLTRGNYYLSACTPNGAGAGKLGCATSQADMRDQGRHADPRRGGAAPARALRAPAPPRGRDCSSGAHTLVKPGERGLSRSPATAATRASTPTSTRSTTRSPTSCCPARTSTCSSARRSA